MSGLVVPGANPMGPGGKMPPTQAFLVQLIEQNKLVITLLETLCRIGLGNTAEDIETTQGISFPIKGKPTKQELIDALQHEMDRLAEEEGDDVEADEPDDLEDAAREALREELLNDQALAFIETEEQADALEVETAEPALD